MPRLSKLPPTRKRVAGGFMLGMVVGVAASRSSYAVAVEPPITNRSARLPTSSEPMRAS